MRAHTLEYHDVVPGDAWNSSGFAGPSADSYKLSASTLESHLDSLASTPDIGTDVRGLVSGRCPVFFTFDDGGSSALAVTADLLERHGWRGHFLMTTSRIGTPGFLGAGDLRELVARGHVVGSHSDSHPLRMSYLSPEAQLAEWITSRQKLEDCLGADVLVASVPGGYFDRAVARAAAAAGIRWLFTSEPVSRAVDVDGCIVLGRYTLRRDHSAAHARALATGAPFARSSQWLVWNAKKLVKRAGGSAYLRVRAALFGDSSR